MADRFMPTADMLENAGPVTPEPANQNAPTRFMPTRDMLQNSVGLEPKRQHTYRESTGTVVDAPYGMTPDEIEYHDDVQNLDLIGKIKGSFTAGSIDTVLNNLETKSIFTPLNEKEQARYNELSARPELQADYAPRNTIEKAALLTAQTLPQFYEMGKGMIGGGAAGAAAGAGVGAAGFGVGAIPGAITGAGIGGTAGAAYKDFEQQAGQISRDLKTVKGVNGEALDPNVVRGAAVAAGIANAGLDLLPFGAVASHIPGFKTIAGTLLKPLQKSLDAIPGFDKIAAPFTKEGMRKVLALPGAQQVFFNFGKRIAEITAVEGATEGAQQAVQIGATEVAKKESPGEFKPITFGEAASQIGTAAAQGALVGGTLGTGLGALNVPGDIATQRELKKEAATEPAAAKEPVLGPETAPIEATNAQETEGTPAVNAEPEPESGNLDQSTASTEGVERGTAEPATAKPTPPEPELTPQQKVAQSLERRAAQTQEAIESAPQGKTAAKTEDLVREARLRNLDQRVNEIDRRINDLDTLREERESAGKPTKAIENKIDRLMQQREPIDQERADLLTAHREADVVQSQAKAEGGNVTLKGEKITKLGEAADKDTLRAVQHGLREGARIARTDTKGAQDAVITAINQSELKPADKGRFIAAIKNVQTSEQATKAIPRIAARINALVQKQRKAEGRAAIKKLLSKTQVTKQSGKPVGKFGDADLQAHFDRLRAISKLSKTAAQEQLLNNLENPNPTPEQAMENKVLSIIGDVDSLPFEDIADTFKTLQELSTEGRANKAAQVEARKERLNETRRQIVSTVLKGRDIEDISQIDWKEKFAKAMNSARAQESAFNNGWFDTLDIMLGDTAEGRAARDTLEDPVFRAIQNEAGLDIDIGNAFTQMAKKAFGIEKDRQLQRKFVEDEKLVNLGEFARDGQIDEDAETETELPSKKPTRWEISKAQARKLWMELQDPTLRPTLVSPEGNGITVEMEDALDDFLSPEDKNFAQAQLDLYQEIYPQIDRVYASVYGVHLPENPFYSPIRRRHQDQIGNANDMLQELKNRASVAPGFTKSRVNSGAKILPQSDVTAMLTHIAQASHFISMAETARDLQAVFSSPSVREAIDATWGKTMLENIDGYIQDFTSGHIERAKGYMDIINKINSNYAKAVLGAKLNMIPKQASSMFAYATDIPLKDYLVGLADFAAHPKEAIETLSKSDLMRKRGASQDVDIAKGAQQQAKALFGRKNVFDDVLLTPVKIGDRSAIYTGGWAVYKYHRDVLKESPEEAMKAFEKSTAAAQQSADLNQLSRLQASKNPFMRTLGMFMSAPNAYYRAEKRAIRQMLRGEIGKAEAAKKIAIMHLVLPSLFQFIADGFAWDDKDQARAAILGSLNGFLVLGSVLESAVSASLGITKRMSKNSSIFMEGVQDLWQAVQDSYHKGEISWPDVVDALGMISGVPVETARNIGGGIEDIADGKFERGIKRVAGYTKKTAEKN